jgi:hypothetical protein
MFSIFECLVFQAWRTKCTQVKVNLICCWCSPLSINEKHDTRFLWNNHFRFPWFDIMVIHNPIWTTLGLEVRVGVKSKKNLPSKEWGFEIFISTIYIHTPSQAPQKPNIKLIFIHLGSYECWHVLGFH